MTDLVASCLHLRLGDHVRVRYRNWRGETAVRLIMLTSPVFWGSTEWHPEPGWLIEGVDAHKKESRIWTVKDMEPA